MITDNPDTNSSPAESPSSRPMTLRQQLEHAYLVALRAENPMATLVEEVETLFERYSQGIAREARLDELKRIGQANPGMFNIVGRIIRGGEDFKTQWWELMGKVIKLGGYKSERIAELTQKPAGAE